MLADLEKSVVKYITFIVTLCLLNPLYSNQVDVDATRNTTETTITTKTYTDKPVNNLNDTTIDLAVPAR